LKKPYVVVLVTTANKEEAEKIVNSLLEAKLIACGNIVSHVTSLFRWAGRFEKAEECLVFLKSRIDLLRELLNRLRRCTAMRFLRLSPLKSQMGQEII